MDERINVVLFEPEIPQNAGNIMRTCVATNCALHMIKPFGFDIESAKFKRATTNHITWADYKVYDSFENFRAQNEKQGDFFFMTRYGKKSHSGINFAAVAPERKIFLVFGKESTGVPYEILLYYLDSCFRIPMAENCRSLNLSNAAAIAIYECMRQLNYPDLSLVEVQKGEDFLESYDEALKFKN